jgi:membrane protease YdiL (CAAX protease family)
MDAQDRPPLITGSRAGDILLGDLGAFGGAFAAEGLGFLTLGILGADGELGLGERMIGSAVTELSDIPLWLSGSPDALALSVGGALLWGGEALSSAGYGVDSRSSNLLYWGKNNLTMYRAYDSYAAIRLRSGAWDNTDFRRYGLLDLVVAPLDYRNYAKPQPWIALGAGLGLTALYTLVATPDPWANAVWTTSRWFVANSETNAAGFVFSSLLYNTVASIYTGVGEEAAFRGFVHEELSTHLGKGWAMAIDTAAFLSMHLFTDLARHMEWDDILAHMLLVAGGNMIYDWAYDEGGLPLAVVCHAALDFAAFSFNDLVMGGAARGGSRR